NLQDLLTRASSLYNNGEYKGAIEAWKEALSVDPQSQRAKEGIRMATLLIGDFEPTPTGEPVDLPAADGAETAPADLPVEEVEARLDLGIAHIKQLLAEHRHAEAIEGAQGLLPLDPNSPELLSLMEQAQNAFEAAPFIEEHLTLARELLAQERFAEAEAECKKVFTLDAAHTGGKELLKGIRDKIQQSLKAAASQLGGMTVKLTIPEALKAAAKPKAAAPAHAIAPAPTPASAPQDDSEAPATEIPEMYAGPEPLGPGDQAALQEDAAARASLEAAFDERGPGGAPDESPFELEGENPSTAAPAQVQPGPANTIEDTIVEAKTVRPPSSRVVPRGPAPAVEKTGTPPAPAAGAVVPPPVVAGQARKAQPPAPAAPPARTAPAAPPAKAAPAAAPTAAPTNAPAAPLPAKAAPAAGPEPSPAIPLAGPSAHDEAASWEAELAQLNLKEKERGLLRGTGAKATGVNADPGDVDLMSLLDNSGMPGMADPGGGTPSISPPSVPLAHAKESVKAPKPADMAKRSSHHHEGAAEVPAEEAPTAMKLRPAERPKPLPPAPKPRSSVMKFLLLLVLLLGGGAAAWVFYIQPRVLGGAGQPGQPVAPPAGSPSGTLEAAQGPIPTPIGGTSRQQSAVPDGNEGAGIAGGAAAESLPAAGTAQGPAGMQPSRMPAPGPGAAASSGSRSTEPIKPTTVPALSQEEVRRKIAVFTADGRRLMGLGKWREARAKLNAVLALDPANIEVKELVDQAQTRIDDGQKLQDEFDSVKSLMIEKDYENALRKLYRLPRDKGLGDIDLYIRNAWYNWAVTLMKAGNSRDALQKLSECLTLDPDDSQALKLQEVAEKYTARAKDRVYYAFADALVLRELGQK
ncbi:MAG: hypothetical protein HYS34_06125, partial [Acidobacteria bacterium]|nr:hypothetical protein [Acidobacteriota bacterium]